MLPLKDLTPVTTVAMISLDKSFKPILPNIFQFLHVGVESHDLTQYSQSRVNRKIPPSLNLNGEILSMRFYDAIRGIRRSRTIRSFPNSIIMDVGASERPVSLKLSSTVEVTGSRSIEKALEALQTVLKYLVEGNNFLLSFYNEVGDRKTEEILECPEIRLKIDTYIRNNFLDRKYESSLEVMKYFLDVRQPLYRGELKICKYTTEMVNYQFRLPCNINITRFAKMVKEPLVAKHNSLGRPIAKVHFAYEKEKNGKKKKAKQVFIVNATGSVMFTGPSFDQMEPIYNTFVKTFYEIRHHVQMKGPVRVRYTRSKPGEIIPMELLDLEEEKARKFRTFLMAEELPFIEKKDPSENPNVEENYPNREENKGDSKNDKNDREDPEDEEIFEDDITPFTGDYEPFII